MPLSATLTLANVFVSHCTRPRAISKSGLCIRDCIIFHVSALYICKYLSQNVLVFLSERICQWTKEFLHNPGAFQLVYRVLCGKVDPRELFTQCCERVRNICDTPLDFSLYWAQCASLISTAVFLFEHIVGAIFLLNYSTAAKECFLTTQLVCVGIRKHVQHVWSLVNIVAAAVPAHRPVGSRVFAYRKTGLPFYSILCICFLRISFLLNLLSSFASFILLYILLCLFFFFLT